MSLSRLVSEYKSSHELRMEALSENQIKPTKSVLSEAIKVGYPMRGTYDNGILYSRRFRLTKTYHKGLAQSITVRINRLIRRRLHQRMAPIKAKRSGDEVYIFVARGNYEHLEPLLPSIYHTTNIIYKYFEKGYNI